VKVVGDTGIAGTDDCKRPLYEMLTASVAESGVSVRLVNFLPARSTTVVDLV